MADQPTDAEVAAAIPALLTGMTARIRDERRQSLLYLELAAQRTLIGRLRLAHHHILDVVLTLTDVLRDVDGIEITRERYALLQGLALTKSEFEEHFRTTEGNAGCVDKAFGTIARALTEEDPKTL